MLNSSRTVAIHFNISKKQLDLQTGDSYVQVLHGTGIAGYSLDMVLVLQVTVGRLWTL